MTVLLPEPTQWIVEPDIVDRVGNQLLDVALGALTLYGRAARYDRVVVQHGTSTVVEPSKANQLAAVCTRIYCGRAGEEQYAFYRGALGQLAFQVAQFQITVTQPWPKRQGVTAIPVPAIDEARAGLWTDSMIVWNAYLALALGAVVTDPVVSDSPSGIAVGPMQPKDPAGGEASFTCQVQVQL